MTEDQLEQTTESLDEISNSLDRGLECECPRDHTASMAGEPYANIPSALVGLCDMAQRIAAAITPVVAGGTDATGGHVESLTEAVMGITGGLVKVAEAIGALAEAIREHGTT